MELREFYRRKLPHYQPRDTAYHIVFRLVDSLPETVLERLRLERELAEQRASQEKNPSRRKGLRRTIQEATFRKFNPLLDRTSFGPKWLQMDATAAIVAEAIHYRDGKVYDLLAFNIMPNHVHLVMFVGRPVWSSCTRKASEPYIVTKILENLKWYTALKCNEVLSRSGQFWEHESYDHIIRQGDLRRTILYVLNNPVKAGLVNQWNDWRWSYCKPGLLENPADG